MIGGANTAWGDNLPANVSGVLTDFSPQRNMSKSAAQMQKITYQLRSFGDFALDLTRGCLWAVLQNLCFLRL